MAFVKREQWGALPRQGDANWTTAPSNRTGVVAHYDGGETPRTEARERELLRVYDRHHYGNGWGGIGYNLAIGPVTGNIYEARGIDHIGAHAGGANTRNYGIIFIGGEGNLSEKAKAAGREAYAMLSDRSGRRLQQLCHSDINSTGCPGNTIRSWVKGGGFVGAGSIPTPEAPYIGRNITTRPTRDVQAKVGAGIDGIYGPQTTRKVREWQARHGLVADGIWGPLSDAKGFSPIGRAALAVDGIWGMLTTLALQRVLGVGQDGIMGPITTAALQRRLGVTPDGIIGPITRRALQRRLGVTPDGIIGPVTIAALQRRLNEGRI